MNDRENLRETATKLVEQIQRLPGDSASGITGKSTRISTYQALQRSAAQLLHSINVGESYNTKVASLQDFQASLYTAQLSGLISSSELDGYITATDEMYSLIDME